MSNIAALKRQAEVAPDNTYSLKSWIETARKTHAAVSAANDQLPHDLTKADSETLEQAYVGYMKWAGIMSIIINHPEYKQTMLDKAGSNWIAYQQLRERLQPAMARIKVLQSQLQQRIDQSSDATMPHQFANGTTSPRQNQAFSPTLTYLPTSPSQGFEMPSSPASASSPPQSPQKERPNSIAQRLAALRSNGLQVSGQSASATSATSSSRAPLKSSQAMQQTVNRTTVEDAGPTPLAKSPSTSSASSMNIDPPTNASTAGAPISRQTSRLQEHAPDRPASAPSVPSQAVNLLDDLLQQQNMEEDEELPTAPAHEPKRPQIAPSLSEFEGNFPSVDELENQFPQFPSVPTSDPSKHRKLPPDPPTKVPHAMDFDRPTPFSPTQGALSSSPATPASPQKSNRSSLQRAGAQRGPLPPVPRKPVSPSIPFTNAVLPSALWSYLIASLPPKILLIDIRTRDRFNALRIGSSKFSSLDSICIEPIILRRERSSSTLENSLFDSPQSEQSAFRHRREYDLVVLCDESSRNIPTDQPLVSDGDSYYLWNLNSALYTREFGQALKRPPVLLIGGIEQWIEQIGRQGLIGEEAGNVQDGVREAKAKLEGRSSRSGSLDVSSGEKKQNRRAAVTDGEVYAAPNIARSVVDVIGSSPYQHGAAAPPNYFARPRMASGSSSFSNSPLSPSLAMPQQAVQKINSNSYEMPMAPIPYNPAPPARSQAYGNLATSTNGRPMHAFDYPNLAPSPQLQRPPLAAQPNGAPSRPPPLAPQNRRLSSNNYLSSAPRPTAVSQQMVPLDWYDGIVGMTGLKNLGNTCYMNSTIQCLSATIPFARYFKDGSYRRQVNHVNPLGTKGALADAVAQLFGVLWGETYTFVSPVTFRDAICRFADQFRGSDQHDSQEFLAFLLDGLHEDLNLVQKKPPAIELTPEREAELEVLPTAVASQREWSIYLRRDNSFIVHWFQGQYKNRMQCQTCGKTSTTYNTFMYLSLPVPSTRGVKVTLEDCLAAFVKEEILEKDDAWNCPQCKAPRRATKQLTIARLPPILLIHLKRFSFKGPFSDKIDTPVQFPIYGLDLTPFVPAPTKSQAANLYNSNDLKAAPPPQPTTSLYDLYAVSQHFGTLSSGHYTAAVRSRNQWSHIGDSKIQHIEENDVRKMTRSAYIYFYRRRDS